MATIESFKIGGFSWPPSDKYFEGYTIGTAATPTDKHIVYAEDLNVDFAEAPSRPLTIILAPSTRKRIYGNLLLDKNVEYRIDKIPAAGNIYEQISPAPLKPCLTLAGTGDVTVYYKYGGDTSDRTADVSGPFSINFESIPTKLEIMGYAGHGDGLTISEITSFPCVFMTGDDEGGMFNGAIGEMDEFKPDLSNVIGLTNAWAMFQDCLMKSLDLTSLDVSQVEYTGWMFSNCANLETLNLSGLNFKSFGGYWMFYKCRNLTTIIGPFSGINDDVSFYHSPLTRESAITVMNALEPTETPRTLTFSYPTYNAVAGQIGIATSKGWTVGMVDKEYWT